jgi:nitrate reductase beta subunit
VEACPYGARYLDEKRGFVDKCNACKQRLDVGQQPACVATCLGSSRMFGDLNDPNSQASLALKDAKTVKTLDIEVREGVDTEPQIYFINGEVQHEGIVPKDSPQYTLAEEGWRNIAIPAVAAGVGLAFAGQAVMFSRQLLRGEDEFEDQ